MSFAPGGGKPRSLATRLIEIISPLPLKTTFTLSIASLFLVHAPLYAPFREKTFKDPEKVISARTDMMPDIKETHKSEIKNPHEKTPSRPVSPKNSKEAPDITRAGAETMRISITFDGGCDADDAEVILKTLSDRGIKTTIFLTGSFMEKHPELTRRMVEDGHEIGNHTMDHPHLTGYADTFRHETLPYVTEEFLIKEIKEAERIFTGITGKKMAPFWRAPYGEINREIREWAYREGYIHIGWTADYKRKESLDTLDWVEDSSSRYYLTSREIKEKILNFGKDSNGLRGGIILMHLDTKRTTDRPSEKLGEIIDALMEKGYSFVKVSELIRGDERFRQFTEGVKLTAIDEKSGQEATHITTEAP